DLIEDKVDELEEAVGRAEARLFRLRLATTRGDDVRPETAFLDWLALSLFRQWLADNTVPLGPQPPAFSPAAAALPRPAPPPPPAAATSNGDARSSRTSRGRTASAAAAAAAPAVVSPTSGQVGMAAAGRAFRVLGGFGAPYLTHDDCKRFLKLTP